MHDSSCSVADPDQFYAIFDYFKWISCSGLWPDTGRYLVVTTCRKMVTQDPRKKYFDISRIQIWSKRWSVFHATLQIFNRILNGIFMHTGTIVQTLSGRQWKAKMNIRYFSRYSLWIPQLPPPPPPFLLRSEGGLDPQYWVLPIKLQQWMHFPAHWSSTRRWDFCIFLNRVDLNPS